MTRNKWLYALVIPLLGLLINRCTTDIAGTSDETDIEITGKLVDGVNGGPAANAEVLLYRANSSATDKPVGITATDNTGSFEFDSIPKGVYSIIATYVVSNDTLYSARQNIQAFEEIPKKPDVDIGTDTLRSPGRISGTVSVEGQASKSGIFCYIPGTSFLAITDTGGSFVVFSVPPGTYPFGYMHYKYKDTTIHGVVVISDKETKLPHMIMKVAVDSLKKSIYGVFEKNYRGIKELEVLVTGDSINAGKPLSFPLDYNPLSHGYSGYVTVPDNGKNWTATIIVYDTLARKTGLGTVSFTNVSSNILVPAFDPCNAVPHLDAGADMLVSKHDTISFYGSAIDSFGGTILRYAWDLNGDGVFDDSSNTHDTVYWVYPATGLYTVQLYALDNDNNSASDTRIVTVPDFKPVVNLIHPSQDTAIWDTIIKMRLYAQASDSFGGRIIGYKWDFNGDGTWDTAYTKNDTVTHTYKSGTNKVIFAGIDDDSNVTADTSLIIVEYSAEIAAGDNYSFIIKTDGSVWGFGETYLGKLGNGKDYPDVLLPVKIVDSCNAVAAHSLHSGFIKYDGTLLMTGDNREGQLGNGLSGYNEKELKPIYITGNVKQMSVGDDFTMALKNDGSLWAIGRNDTYGQLGIDSMGGSTVPVRVIDNVLHVTTGMYHTVVIKSDSTLWAWGSNRDGQIGNGKAGYYEEERSPVQVMSNVKAVDAGWHYTMVIKNDGSLWAWGSNTFGQLGNGLSGNNELDSIPVYIMGNVAFVSAGKEHTMIIKRDGSLWASGNNEYGQFGNGSKTSSNTFVKIMNNVSSVSAGATHTIIIKGDGSIWACGNNENGQLGDGTTEEKTTPVQVPLKGRGGLRFAAK